MLKVTSLYYTVLVEGNVHSNSKIDAHTMNPSKTMLPKFV